MKRENEEIGERMCPSRVTLQIFFCLNVARKVLICHAVNIPMAQ